MTVLQFATGCNDGKDNSDGGADAGPRDGGAIDAGVDSGTVDSGVDSGAPDAGTDAGQVDAGVDGGATDSGVVDAGPPCGIPLGDTVNATLYMSIDDEGTLYINGKYVAEQTIPWNAPLVRTIQVNRNPTVPNVVAIEARNVYAQGGVDRAALVDFRLGDGGDATAPQIFASGTGWKSLLASDAGSSDGGWTRVGFDDSTWTASVAVLNYGDSPYGNIFAQFGINSSAAKWMWAYDVAATPSRPAAEPIYFRHVFFFTADGGFSNDAGVCP